MPQYLIFLIQLWSFLEIIAVLSIIFIDRKNANDALAWILVVSLIPFLGFIFYLFFGDTLSMKLHFRYYRHYELDDHIQDLIENQKKLLDSSLDVHAQQKAHDLIYLLMNQSQSFYTLDNHIDVLNNADEKYPYLFEDLKQAKSSICIAYYIISDNQTGHDFMHLLIEKAKQGVEVRLIHDFFGVYFLYHHHRHYFDELEKYGGKVVRFLPSGLDSIFRINYRYHRKMVIIDSRIAYTGGINIGDEYLGKRKHVSPWRDTSIRIQGDGVYDLLMSFLKDWEFVKHHSKKNKLQENYDDLFKDLTHHSVGSIAMQLVTYGPQDDTMHIRDGYIKMINNAKNYLYIETPYFIPDESFMTSLKLALASGVDIKIIIPGIPDKKLVYYATLSHISEFLSWGGTVYLYDGFIHSKSIVTDNYVTTIGTTNIDIRSFKLDFEINAFMYDEDFARKNRIIFEHDLAHAHLFTYQDYQKLPLFKRLLGNIVRLFSFLI